MARFREIRLDAENGTFSGVQDGRGLNDVSFSARFDLFLIREAWDRGCDLEDLADGFGEGIGTMGDWSGVRDSSDEAKERMFERALNHLFG